MPDALIHPTPQQLVDFGLGKLPDRAAAAVAAHLESCPVCRKAVAAVPPDSFLGKVRAAGPAGSSFPPGLARPDNAQSSAGRPAIAVVPSPDVPPELARHPKYLILRELGRGGMGVVYQARQTVMNRPVVIKVINRSLLERPGVLERFRREIQAAARLSHPNIVTAYDAEQAGDLHMLVMEFVPGQSLAEVLEKKGPLPVSYACHFARQVALGLQHAHERNLVHRDIKPQNLILSLKNQIKILDFGLAKVVREEGTSTGLTSSDSCMGTAEYMAPEQAKNARSADIRADLYSLGCTLYCQLAGCPPFREDTWMNTVLAHIQKEPQPLTELRPDVPAALWQVVARLLAKEPAQRYQKPIEVVQALAPFVKPGTKPVAKDVSSPPPGVRPVKGTVIEADTNEVKKVLRSVPGKASSKEVPAKVEASPFENLENRPALPKKAKGTRESTKRMPASWSRRWPVLVGVGVLLLAFGVIMVKTPEGTIVLEDLPDDAEVLVDGKKVTVTWDKGGKKAEIRVKPGTHKVEVKKDGARVKVTKDSFSVDGKELTFKDGDRVIFTVRLLADTKKPDDIRGANAAADDKGFVPLFNGKDKTGWSVDGGPSGQWVVEGDTIVAQSKHFSTRNYLLTDKDYADFVLRFDFKVEEGNQSGGVAIRATEGEKMPLNNNLIFDHPIIKLTDPANDKEPTGTAHWLKSAAVYIRPVEVLPLPTGMWHSMEVTVRGDHCAATVDGKKLVALTLDPDAGNNGAFVPGLGRRKGKVGFQINTGILRFRNIEIKELPATKAKTPPAAKPEVGSRVKQVEDLIVPGSVWKGTITYRKGGWVGTTVAYEIRIRESDGKKFKGLRFDRRGNRGDIEGEVKGETITWRENIRGADVLITVEGRLTGDTIDVTFNRSYGNGLRVEGDGKLKREGP